MNQHTDYHQGQRDRRAGKPLTHSSNKHWIKGWKDEDKVLESLSPPEDARSWSKWLEQGG